MALGCGTIRERAPSGGVLDGDATVVARPPGVDVVEGGDRHAIGDRGRGEDEVQLAPRTGGSLPTGDRSGRPESRAGARPATGQPAGRDDPVAVSSTV